MDARNRPLLVRYTIMVAAGLVMLNFGITVIERNNPARILAARLQKASNNDYLFLGNSLIAAGIDTDVCKKQQVTCMNAGIGSTQSSEHAAIAQEAITSGVRGKLIYGFMDLTLSESAELGWKGNRAVLRSKQPFQIRVHPAPKYPSTDLSGLSVGESRARQTSPVGQVPQAEVSNEHIWPGR